MANTTLRDFQVSPSSRWDATSPWGGGHTLETDPTRRGWRLRPQPGNPELAVIGRPGKKGCLSAMFLSGGVDVATYDDLDPKTLSERLKLGKVPADAFKLVPAIPGWVLEFVWDIERAEREE